LLPYFESEQVGVEVVELEGLVIVFADQLFELQTQNAALVSLALKFLFGTFVGDFGFTETVAH
jgi:hypothetical protein